MTMLFGALSVILALVAAGLGLRAACCWFEASKVVAAPDWPHGLEPTDPIWSNLSWVVALNKAATASG